MPLYALHAVAYLTGFWHDCRLFPWPVVVLLGCFYCAVAFWQRNKDSKSDWIRFADMPAASVTACVSCKHGL